MTRLVTAPLALLLAVALASGGCGRGRSGSLGPGPTGAAPQASTPVSPPPGPTTEASGLPPQPGAPGPTGSATRGGPPAAQPSATLTIQLWFTRAGDLVPTRRTRPATVATSRLALTELVAGPSSDEAAAGVTNAVPAGTTFTIAGISGGVATVTFDASFYAGDAAVVRLRRAQVVYTLTQFPTVTKVSFQSSGQPVGRADYADLLPAIVVLGPVIGQRVSSPVTITGTADVYEATVSVRILDASGGQIATAFTTASCGSGCRGDYSVAVAYRLGAEQRGVIEVYAVSPVDGSRVNVTKVPVTLAVSRG